MRYKDLRRVQHRDYLKLRRYKAKIESLYLVDLNDEQSEELGDFVEKVSEQHLDEALGPTGSEDEHDEDTREKKEAGEWHSWKIRHAIVS
jgi:hypothetical protein